MGEHQMGYHRARREDALWVTALCWIVVAGAAQLVWLVEPWLAAGPALVGAIAVAPLAGGTALRRACSALVVLSAAAAPLAPAAGWTAAAVAAAVALSITRRTAPADRLATLRRHLERCRRSGEPACVFVARLTAASDAELERLGDSFRLSDSVELLGSDHGPLLCGVVSDSNGFQLDGLRSRLQLVLGPGAAPGWARFPEDGATLDVLLEQAAAGAGSAAATRGRSPLPARAALAPVGE